MDQKKIRLFFGLLISALIGMGIGVSTQPKADAVKPREKPKSNVNYVNKLEFPIEKLKEGGFVVLFRHSSREKTEDVWGSRNVGFPKLLKLDLNGECAPGSELNAAGKKEAQLIASVMKEMKIPVGEVLSSPTCRTLQMAEIIFGKNFKINNDLIYIYMREPLSHEMHNKALLKLLNKPTQKGKNRFLVSHNNVLREDTIGVTLKLKQSDAAVFMANTKNQFIFVGKIKKGDWAALSSK